MNYYFFCTAFETFLLCVTINCGDFAVKLEKSYLADFA